MIAHATSIRLPSVDGLAARSPGLPRLALFISSLHCGGAERVTVNLLRAASAAGVPLDLLLGKAEGPLLAEVPPQVRIIDFNVPKMRHAIPQIARYLRRERPCGVISQMTHVNLTFLIARGLARTKTPLIVVEHSRFSARLEQGMSPRVKQLAHWLYPFADHVVGVSAGVARDTERHLGLPTDSVQTIYNPIVDGQLLARAAEPSPHAWLAEPQSQNAACPVLLTVGRLERPKDHATLLRAFAIVRQARPARLIIFGEGSQRAPLEALRHELNLATDVALPGAIANPYAAMSRASLFILSSRSEGLPTVLVEALACGCPTVSTTCPSGPTEILAGGRYGILVPPENPAALAAGILQGLDRHWDRAMLCHRGGEFSLTASLDQYLTTIDYPRRPSAAAA